MGKGTDGGALREEGASIQRLLYSQPCVRSVILFKPHETPCASPPTLNQSLLKTLTGNRLVHADNVMKSKTLQDKIKINFARTSYRHWPAFPPLLVG